MRPYVVEESGGREAAAQRDGGPGGQCGRPVGDHRVAVEHRHADVVDVLAPDAEVVDERPSGRRKPSLGADRGLGRAGRSGGEVEQHPGSGPDVTAGRVARFDSGVRGQEFGVRVGVGHQHPYAREVQAVEQRQMGAFGDQDPAVGVQDVAGQFGAAPGRVDPGHGGPGQGRRAQPEWEFGGVVQQHPDVRFAARRQQIRQERGPCGSARGDLVVTENGVPMSQSGPVVAPLALYELRNGACAPHGAAR